MTWRLFSDEQPTGVSYLARFFDNELGEWVFTVCDPGPVNILIAAPYTHWIPLGELLNFRAQIKPLVWTEITAPREDGPREPTGGYEALCGFGVYSVVVDADEDMANSPFCAWSPEENLGHFSMADEAKAAAQRDYETRIRSALAEAP